MANHKTCDKCGGSLDFGESCDCGGRAVKAAVYKTTETPKYGENIMPNKRPRRNRKNKNIPEYHRNFKGI